MSDPENKGYIVKRRGAIGSARASFSCNSKTCRTKQGARVYELPAATTRCAVCGSKRIQRLMFAPNISSGKAKTIDRIMEPGHTRQQRQHDDAKLPNRNTPMLGRSMQNGLAGAVRAAMGGGSLPVPAVATGQSKPTLGITSPQLLGAKTAGMTRVPTEVVAKWTPKPGERV